MASVRCSIVVLAGFHSLIRTVIAVQSEAHTRPVEKSTRALLVGREGENLGFLDGEPFQPPADVREHKIHVTINHLAKAGGTFVHDIVEKSLPKDRLTWEREGDGITETESKENFVIGMVRNPFNYYVSLWSYTSDKNHCCFRNSLPLELQEQIFSQEKVLGSTEEDRRRFRRWLRYISTPQLGLMSMRFYGSYLNYGSVTILGSRSVARAAKAANEWEKGAVPWVLENRARYLLGMPEKLLPGMVNATEPPALSSQSQQWQQSHSPTAFGLPSQFTSRRAKSSPSERSKSTTRSVLLDAAMQSRIMESSDDRKQARLHNKMKHLSEDIVKDTHLLLTRMKATSEFGNRAVNCWMYTERITPDLQACLKRYEDVARKFEGAKVVVDWDRFHHEINDANHNEALPHVDCHAFYDQDTAKFVLHSDAAIFEAFGYPGHCS